MSRRSTFIADAESVQGNKGATATFKACTLAEYEDYRTSSKTDKDMLIAHLLEWSKFEDDEGHALPNPKDEPGIIDKLYLAEVRALARLLYTGAPAIPLKN